MHSEATRGAAATPATSDSSRAYSPLRRCTVSAERTEDTSLYWCEPDTPATYAGVSSEAEGDAHTVEEISELSASV